VLKTQTQSIARSGDSQSQSQRQPDPQPAGSTASRSQRQPEPETESETESETARSTAQSKTAQSEPETGLELRSIALVAQKKPLGNGVWAESLHEPAGTQLQQIRDLKPNVIQIRPSQARPNANNRSAATSRPAASVSMAAGVSGESRPDCFFSSRIGNDDDGWLWWLAGSLVVLGRLSEHTPLYRNLYTRRRDTSHQGQMRVRNWTSSLSTSKATSSICTRPSLASPIGCTNMACRDQSRIPHGTS